MALDLVMCLALANKIKPQRAVCESKHYKTLRVCGDSLHLCHCNGDNISGTVRPSQQRRHSEQPYHQAKARASPAEIRQPQPTSSGWEANKMIIRIVSCVTVDSGGMHWTTLEQQHLWEAQGPAQILGKPPQRVLDHPHPWDGWFQSRAGCCSGCILQDVAEEQAGDL